MTPVVPDSGSFPTIVTLSLSDHVPLRLHEFTPVENNLLRGYLSSDPNWQGNSQTVITLTSIIPDG